MQVMPLPVLIHKLPAKSSTILAKEKAAAPTPEAAEPEKVLEKEEEIATEEEEDEPLNEITLDLGGSDYWCGNCRGKRDNGLQ